MATQTTSISEPLTHPGDGVPTTTRFHHAALAANSVASPDRPDTNQDAVLLMPAGPDSIVLAVADGCGGMPAGDRASAAAIAAVKDAVADLPDDDPTAAVLAAFDRANTAVADLRIGAGSTLTIALITASTVRVFHAGDSPALVVGHRGHIRFTTLSHSLVGFGVEAGLITEHEAQTHQDSGVVLNVLGFPEMFVQVGPPITLRPMDTVLLASDGLSDNLTIDQIAATCRVGTAAQALDALISAATHAMTQSPQGHPDDLSIAIYRPTRRRSE